MFIDASAAVAIILDEPDREELRGKLKSAARRGMSALSIYESVMAIRREKRITVSDAYGLVLQFQEIFRIDSIAVEGRFAEAALDAFTQYGRGQGHPAKLNMGDCFSYACAKLLKVPLLCKGNDFKMTDINVA